MLLFFVVYLLTQTEQKQFAPSTSCGAIESKLGKIGAIGNSFF